MNKEEIPFFEDNINKIREDKKTVERNAVSSIIFDPKNKKVLCLKWNSYDWKTFVNGGINDKEDNISAALREIKEETGYTDLKFIKEIDKVRASFYQAQKDENRITNTTGLLFELVSDTLSQVDTNEKEKHLPIWVSAVDVKSYVNIDWQLYLWQKLIDQGFLF